MNSMDQYNNSIAFFYFNGIFDTIYSRFQRLFGARDSMKLVLRVWLIKATYGRLGIHILIGPVAAYTAQG
jgi:hypothetical protein